MNAPGPAIWCTCMESSFSPAATVATARHSPTCSSMRTRLGIPQCECGGWIRPNIVWFGEVPFHMERIFEELHRCTLMLVVGTSGMVQPAASFVLGPINAISRRPAVRTCYVGPEHPANAAAFTQVFEGRAGELLPKLFW